MSEKEKLVRLTITVTEHQKVESKVKAYRQGISVSQVVRQALQAYIDEPGVEPAPKRGIEVVREAVEEMRKKERVEL